MPQYLIILRPARLGMLLEGPTETERAVIGEHFAYLDGLCKRGQVILFGRTANSDAETLGLVVFEADNDAAAQALLDHDPAVRAGVFHARLWPYRIAGLSAGSVAAVNPAAP